MGRTDTLSHTSENKFLLKSFREKFRAKALTDREKADIVLQCLQSLKRDPDSSLRNDIFSKLKRKKHLGCLKIVDEEYFSVFTKKQQEKLRNTLHGAENMQCKNDESGSPSGECAICLDNHVDCMITPCRHVITCFHCMQSLNIRQCPFRCPGEIKEVLQFRNNLF